MSRVKVMAAEGEDPQPAAIMERAIMDLAAGMKRLDSSRLKREAIVLLLHDASRVGKPDIRRILDCMGDLEKLFLKPKIMLTKKELDALGVN